MLVLCDGVSCHLAYQGRTPRPLTAGHVPPNSSVSARWFARPACKNSTRFRQVSSIQRGGAPHCRKRASAAAPAGGSWCKAGSLSVRRTFPITDPAAAFEISSFATTCCPPEGVSPVPLKLATASVAAAPTASSSSCSSVTSGFSVVSACAGSSCSCNPKHR